MYNILVVELYEWYDELLEYCEYLIVIVCMFGNLLILGMFVL